MCPWDKYNSTINTTNKHIVATFSKQETIFPIYL